MSQIIVVDPTTDVIEVVGAGGPPGPQGPAGADGATGPQGPAGPAGADGASTFLSGVGAPTAGVGSDGAIYLDTTTGRIWGPKTAGAWPGQPLGRIIPTDPTYAQLESG
jgi:hypothetical protein